MRFSLRNAGCIALGLPLLLCAQTLGAQPPPADPPGAAPEASPSGEGDDNPRPDAADPKEGTAANSASSSESQAEDGEDLTEEESGAEDEEEEEDEEGGFLDELEITWGGKVQSDLRFRLTEESVGEWYGKRTFPVGIDRNENILTGRLTATYGDVRAVVDLDFVLYGFQQDVELIGDLSRREKVDPFRFDAHKLYIEVKNLFLDGLDVRVGQQLILWGVGDQFNPTNNLNADDVEDVLLFGEQQGNFMVSADYWITDDWSISGVLVPVFKPALLPRTGQLSLAFVDRIPVADEQLRWRLLADQQAARQLANYPTAVREVKVELPERSIENVQIGYRIGGTVGGQDIALSYYRGRFDFPVAKANTIEQQPGQRCNPDNAAECIDGLLANDVTVHFPEMHVYGFNMAGEIPTDRIADALHALGYRMEVALIVPQRTDFEIQTGALDVAGLMFPASEYDYDGDGAAGGPRSAVIRDTPFAKWVLGLDYTFNEHVYTNVQWVHGMPDEFGAGDWITEGYALRAGRAEGDAAAITRCSSFGAILGVSGGGDASSCAYETLKNRISDYLVTGIDVWLMQQKLLARLFTIFDLTGIKQTFPVFDEGGGFVGRGSKYYSMFTKEGFSAVIYPELNYNFGNGLVLGAGALVQIGKPYTKFGDPAAGGTILWTRTRFNF